MTRSQPNRANTISIVVNEQRLDLPIGSSVEQLLAHLSLQRRGLAVEINGELVPQQSFAERHLRGEDRVEVVTLVGGG